MGDQVAQETPAGALKVKVYAYKQPTARSAPQPQAEGFEWGSADVEVCVPDAGTVSRVVWHLSFADNTTVDPSNIGYNQFPQPEYPWDERPVRAGQCVRGWITFGVPRGVRPATVVYQPEGTTMEWTVI